ncbi:hypothetical protein [Serratia sp. (in: enterobacteria)]|uniref:hypothetical protein n=1 Tax=Serratia sp. (in: enterobacteria) TaxID=616 RepID=UPI003989F947
MKNTLLICGHGPGISHAVARRFDKVGHPVALIARNVQRLAKAHAQQFDNAGRWSLSWTH